MIKKFKTFEAEDYDNKHGDRFWGDSGAGVLIYCKPTKRFLIPFRSRSVNEPHTYGIFGGAMDEGETPEESAERELVEESGYNGKFELFPAYIYVSPNKTFTYYNFLGLIEKEFNPEEDWETESSEWYTYQELLDLEPKHFGLKLFLEESKSLIEKNL